MHVCEEFTVFYLLSVGSNCVTKLLRMTEWRVVVGSWTTAPKVTSLDKLWPFLTWCISHTVVYEVGLMSHNSSFHQALIQQVDLLHVFVGEADQIKSYNNSLLHWQWPWNSHIKKSLTSRMCRVWKTHWLVTIMIKLGKNHIGLIL